MSPSLSAVTAASTPTPTKKGKKSFCCDVCDKKFTRNSSLQTHMNIHLNIKPYECSICKFRFNANPNLIRHKKNVHNMKFSSSHNENTSSTNQVYEICNNNNNNSNSNSKKNSLSSDSSVSLSSIEKPLLSVSPILNNFSMQKDNSYTLNNKPTIQLSSNILSHNQIKNFSQREPLNKNRVYKNISNYNNNNNNQIIRTLPEPIYNFSTAHPVKFLDLVRYETVTNLVDAKNKLNFAPHF